MLTRLPSQECLLLADFTVAPFIRALEASGETPHLTIRSAPARSIFSSVDKHLSVDQPRTDFVIVWTSAHEVAPTLAKAIQGNAFDLEEIKSQTEAFVSALRNMADSLRIKAMLVMNWCWPSWRRGFGILEGRPGQGLSDAVRRMNTWMADSLRNDDRIHVLDASTFLNRTGEESFDPKLWYLAKIPFSKNALADAAAEVKAAIRALLGLSRKLIILDLDNTLWGGTVGDDGWQNLRLGGHDAVGEAFLDFQSGLKALKTRGILLAIASKNTEEVALEAITNHPEMLLRPSDFVTWRINWDDKVQNILQIAAEVNIGLDAVVFIDDDPAQRSRAKQAIPELCVPNWPANTLLYRQALERLTCFDALARSREDEVRTTMYQQEKQRKSLMGKAQSRQHWLHSLELKVTIERLGPGNIKRAAQLLNKTNQMNLSTRRMTESELLTWATASGNDVFVGRVADRFGDYGLTAIVSTTVSRESATIIDFVISCRVLDRGVEEALLYCAAQATIQKGAHTLQARLTPTSRNTPCKLFFEERSGFEKVGENVYRKESLANQSLPSHLSLTYADAAAEWSKTELKSLTNDGRTNNFITRGQSQ